MSWKVHVSLAFHTCRTEKEQRNSKTPPTLLAYICMQHTPRLLEMQR